MRRLLAALLSCVLVLGACSGSDGDEAVATLDTSDLPATSDAPAFLRAASVQAQEAGSARFTVGFTMRGIPDMPGEVSFGGEGAFDYPTGAMQMTLDLGDMFDQMAESEPVAAGFDFGDGEMEMRVVDGTGYLRFSLFSMFTGGDAEWLSFPADDMAGAGSFSPVPGGSNPADLFALLGGGEDIEILGTETVRGVETTHYRGIFDPQAAAEQIPEGYRGDYDEVMDQLGDVTFPIDVWVDDSALIRRMTMEMDGASLGVAGGLGGGGGGSMTFTMELFDYGTDVDVEAPAGAVSFEDAGLGEMMGGFGN